MSTTNNTLLLILYYCTLLILPVLCYLTGTYIMVFILIIWLFCISPEHCRFLNSTSRHRDVITYIHDT